MKAITATIQKEQNQVIRHEDVPVLLVNGIAGSGKTSVLMQRIAYLFYQQRESLRPEDVFLITPNPVFSRYIENVLPDLGESNPETMTFNEFMATIMPADRSRGRADISLESLQRIDDAVAGLVFDPNDFKDIVCEGTQLLSAGQIRQVADKFKRIPAGPHLVTLMREELHKRLSSRLKQMATTERAQNEMLQLSIQEQVRIFHETIEPQNENEARELALIYLNDRYARAFDIVERDEWLRIDRRHAPSRKRRTASRGVGLPQNGMYGSRQSEREVRHGRRSAGLHHRSARHSSTLFPPSAFLASGR